MTDAELHQFIVMDAYTHSFIGSLSLVVSFAKTNVRLVSGSRGMYVDNGQDRHYIMNDEELVPKVGDDCNIGLKNQTLTNLIDAYSDMDAL